MSRDEWRWSTRCALKRSLLYRLLVNPLQSRSLFCLIFFCLFYLILLFQRDSSHWPCSCLIHFCDKNPARFASAVEWNGFAALLELRNKPQNELQKNFRTSEQTSRVLNQDEPHELRKLRKRHWTVGRRCCPSYRTIWPINSNRFRVFTPLSGRQEERRQEFWGQGQLCDRLNFVKLQKFGQSLIKAITEFTEFTETAQESPSCTSASDRRSRKSVHDEPREKSPKRLTLSAIINQTLAAKFRALSRWTSQRQPRALADCFQGNRAKIFVFTARTIFVVPPKLCENFRKSSIIVDHFSSSDLRNCCIRRFVRGFIRGDCIQGLHSGDCILKLILSQNFWGFLEGPFRDSFWGPFTHSGTRRLEDSLGYSVGHSVQDSFGLSLGDSLGLARTRSLEQSPFLFHFSQNFCCFTLNFTELDCEVQRVVRMTQLHTDSDDLFSLCLEWGPHGVKRTTE